MEDTRGGCVQGRGGCDNRWEGDTRGEGQAEGGGKVSEGGVGGLRAEDWEGWGMSGWFGGVRGVYTLVMNIEIHIIHEKTADHTSLLQQPQPTTFRFYLPKSLSPKTPL